MHERNPGLRFSPDRVSSRVLLVSRDFCRRDATAYCIFTSDANHIMYSYSSTKQTTTWVPGHLDNYATKCANWAADASQSSLANGTSQARSPYTHMTNAVTNMQAQLLRNSLDFAQASEISWVLMLVLWSRLMLVS